MTITKPDDEETRRSVLSSFLRALLPGRAVQAPDDPEAEPGFFRNLQRIRYLLSRRRKLQLVVLCILLGLTALFEMLTLGAIPPFLAAMSNPDRLMEMAVIGPILQALSLEDADAIRLTFAGAFAAIAIVGAAVRLTYRWASVRLSQAILCDLSEHSFDVTLSREWSDHVRDNSSRAIAGVLEKTRVIVDGVISPLMNLGSAIAVTLAILITMLLVEPAITLTMAVIAIVFYATLLRLVRARVKAISGRMARFQTERVNLMQASIGGMREIILDGAAAIYTRQFSRIARTMARDHTYMSLLDNIPRIFVDLFVILLAIGILVTSILSGSESEETFATVAFLAFGAMRLMPNLQGIFATILGMRAAQGQLIDALDIAEQARADIPETGQAPLPFSSSLDFRDVWFRYAPDLPWVLQGIDLTIRPGERIGVIGATGSGKSSLVDLMMGLLRPDKGEIAVDGAVLRGVARRRWMSRIAHVPQAVFLTDENIEDNIVFGAVGTPDREQIRMAAEQAQIGDLVRQDAGERGIRLSGGQRQRVGIARALYRCKDVLVLDEATSALDDATERRIMETLDGLGREITVIMIAHRLSTLRSCDRIIELEAGRIKRIVNGYDQL